MSEFEFTPAERKYIEASEVYTRFSTVKFSSLTVATIVTALNAITPSPENAPLIKWLVFLIRMLAQDSSGRKTVIDQNSADSLSAVRCGAMAAQSGISLGGADYSSPTGYAQKICHRLAYKSITLAGGAKADQELVAALSGYKGRCLIRAVTSDTPDTYTFLFQDAGDQPIAHPVLARSIVVGTALVPVNFAQPILAVNSTANSAIEIDVSGGAGAEVLEVEYETWYEL